MSQLFVLVGAAAFAYKRLLHYLRFFQQEEYDAARFLRWLVANKVYDRKGTAAFFISGLLTTLLPNFSLLLALALMGALLAIAASEEDPRTEGKITLKMTERAKRIFALAALVIGITLLAIGILGKGATFFSLLILFAQSLPLSLCVAKALLQPDEQRRQARFMNEAKAILRDVHPYVVAITGSYGKTTTKAFLGKLLEVALAPTFWPPKSVNTPMGITREIRERLKPGHKYAVIEMGAYREGSIRGLCELVPPNAAIVTAVGIMHLERFGSPENVYRAKSELPRAVPEDGILVCNGDNPGSRRMATELAKKTTLVYGLERDRGPLDSFIDSVAITPDGTSFAIHWKGERYDCFTKLHGTPALSNILAAFTLAAALGADPTLLVAAIRSLEPFDNRLEVRRMGDGLQINDAYNSNPDGFLAALNVLRSLPANKRILVTPGMIELGTEQRSENLRVAQAAAKIVTDAIVVGPTNRDAIVEGLRTGGLESSHIHLVENREEGFRTLDRLRGSGDAVLIENDLPDLFEFDLKF